MNTTVTIIREVEITVEARYVPAVRATHMQPPEPPTIIIDEAYDDTSDVMLTDAEREEVERLVLESPPEPDYD